MRGDDRDQSAMFSYVSPEARVRQEHPLRPIRQMVDEALRELSPRFEGLYAKTGRPSIPPEHLLRALPLQVLYTSRSERMLMENRNGLVVQARLTQVTGRSCEPSCCCRAVGIWALHESRGSVVFLGAGVTVNMFVHYVEECACVGYCYVKRFPGVVIEDGVETAIRSAVGFCKCTVPMSSTSSYRSHAQSRCDFMRSSEHLSAWSNSQGSPTTERDGSDAVFGDVLVSR